MQLIFQSAVEDKIMQVILHIQLGSNINEQTSMSHAGGAEFGGI
jgi:hypothetical protein